MATDTLAMSLLIRLMPLMQREFALRIDPGIFFSDEGYRDAVLSSALDASEPRLRGYAEQLRQRLAVIGYGSPGALRSAANALRSPTQEPSDFDRTAPGSLGDFMPSRPAEARALRGGAPAATPPAPTVAPSASSPGGEPGAPAAPDEPPPAGPARKYVGRLR